MCVNTEAGCRKALEYAELRGDKARIAYLQERIEEFQKLKVPLYQKTAFAHPELMVFTNDKPGEPQYFSWGLIPSWCKTFEQADKLRKFTVNAKIHEMFDKPSFKDSAINKRCLVYFDAFYEHHDYNKKKYPFRISLKSGMPLIIAGLWSEWTDPASEEIYKTFAICTTDANPLMAKVHNKPANSDTPRMPVILNKADQDNWLLPIDKTKKEDIEFIKSFGRPYDENLMQAWTVQALSGKKTPGNIPEARDEYKYEDLVFS